MKIHQPLLLTAAIVIAVAACEKEETTPGPSDDDAVAVQAGEATSRTLEERMSSGKRIYAAHCSACHLAEGQGLAGVFPPVAESSYLAENGTDAAVSAILNGLSGAITVNGIEYNGAMPNLSYLSDSEIADVVTFVMNSWKNPGGEVNSDQVAAARGG